MADKFLNFLDMLDGGGKGASGAEFEGGGLLSGLGNALFKPAGYAEREEERLAGIRPQSRPQRGVRPAQVTVPTVPEAPYAGDYFGVDQLPMQQGLEPNLGLMSGVGNYPMAVNPAAYNQTLNFEPSEQDSIRGRLNQLYGGNYISDGLGASDANIAFNKGPYSSGVSGVVPAIDTAQIGMQQNAGFQQFLSEMQNDPRYDPRYVDERQLYKDYIELGL